MFEGAIEAILGWINQAILSLQSNAFLTGPINSLGPDLYSYVGRIYDLISMPIGLTILGVFLMFALYEVSLTMDERGGDIAYAVIRVLLKFLVIKVFFDNTKMIMEALFSLSTVFTNKIGGIIPPQAINPGIDMDVVSSFLTDLDIATGLVNCLIALIVYLVVLVIVKIIEIICMARFIQIYFMIAISPIPMAFLPSREQSQVAKNFLKSFFAVCIQGAAIFMVLSFYPILMSSYQFGTDFTSIGDLVMRAAGMVILVGLAVFKSGQWAKQVVGSM